MSLLLKYRESLNLTQEQLAEKAQLSVRTIQRIEAGKELKGHTLDALSKALGVTRDKLVPSNPEEEINISLMKIINISSLFLIFIPLASILFPLIITKWKKAFNPITKQIISVQILWTCSVPLIILVASHVGKYTSINHEMVPLAILFMLIVNTFIILRNAIELDRKRKLRIYLKFSVI